MKVPIANSVYCQDFEKLISSEVELFPRHLMNLIWKNN